ncbi:hypothetical protein KAT92_01890, partial [Candidatus Babeliales bacterium]|nr:hypothetical protein [Candidatus Babeliales bacterium]
PLFLCFPVTQCQVLAESRNRATKTVIGVVMTVGAFVLWRHFDKKIAALEKVKKVFEKVTGVDRVHAHKIKILVRYKYYSLFVALLGCGYTFGQVMSWMMDDVKRETEKEDLSESSVATLDDVLEQPVEIEDTGHAVADDLISTTEVVWLPGKIGSVFYYSMNKKYDRGSRNWLAFGCTKKQLEDDQTGAAINSFDAALRAFSWEGERSAREVWQEFKAEFERQFKIRTSCA